MHYNLKNLEAIFDKIAGHRSKWEVFDSMLDYYLLFHRYYPTAEKLEEVRHQALSCPDKVSILGFFQEIADLQPEGFGDPLGEFYMQHLANSRIGQYFTPEPLTKVLAQKTIGTKSKAGQKVLDPACGTGRTLLAAASINRHMYFYGADLDATCCKMALSNMMMNSLTGEIAHMNSITNEFFRGYQCRTKLVSGFYYPYFIEFTEPEKSRIWLHAQATATSDPIHPANDGENQICPVDIPTRETSKQDKPFNPIDPDFKKPLHQDSLF